MVEAFIGVCGVLLLGGIIKVCVGNTNYSSDYCEHLRNNRRRNPDALNPKDFDYYRYL